MFISLILYGRSTGILTVYFFLASILNKINCNAAWLV